MEPRIIDLAPLLRGLERQIEEADQEARTLQLKSVRLRGLRDGVLMAVKHAQQPVMTSGQVDPPRLDRSEGDGLSDERRETD